MRYLVAVLLLLVLAFTVLQLGNLEESAGIPAVVSGQTKTAPAAPVPSGEALPDRVVLDISVHTLEELQVLFDRAESYAMTPRPAGENASIVLVLHGPEVDFFSIRNYAQYKDIVDQAARLDAFEVVDIRICQGMMRERGIAREDIPSFIEQVPLGSAEIDRLIGEGYVYF